MMLGANSALSPVVTFMTLQFTLMARECFDALQNWSDEHSYVKVILAGRSSGEITDEEAAQKVLAEYFEKNPDHLPTSNGRRFFCIAIAAAWILVRRGCGILDLAVELVVPCGERVVGGG